LEERDVERQSRNLSSSKTHDQMAASPAQCAESDGRNVTAHGIEDNVHRTVNQLAEGLPPIFNGVVDSFMGCMSDCERSLVACGGGRDDVPTQHLADLDRCCSGPSGCSKYEEILSRAQFSQLLQPVHGCQIVHRHGGSLSKRQMIRYPGQFA